jgi:hypothetical protein
LALSGVATLSAAHSTQLSVLFADKQHEGKF